MNYSIRRFFLFTVLIATCSDGNAQAQAPTQPRIATVKIRELFENYAKARDNDAAFRKRMAGVAGEAKAKRETFQKGKEELSKFKGNVNDPEAMAKLKELKELEQGILQFEQKARAEAEEESKKLRAELLADMKKVIEAKAKAGNYSLVINVSAENAAGVPDVPFSAGDNDITKDVLTELNAGLILKDVDLSQFTDSSAKPAEKTAEKPAEKKPEKKK